MARTASKSALTAPRTSAQNQAIHAAMSALARASGLSRDELDPSLRDLCRDVSGQTHTAQLTVGQAGIVLDRLNRRLKEYAPPEPVAAPHQPWGPRGPGTRDEQPVTEFQSSLIGDLFTLCGYPESDPKRRQRFILRQCGNLWPQSMEEADKVIQPLTEMSVRNIDRDAMRLRLTALSAFKLTAWETQTVANLAAGLDAGRAVTAVFRPGTLGKIMEIEAACLAGKRKAL